MRIYWLMFAVSVLIVVVVMLVIENVDKMVFMDECSMDMKKYECSLAWRAHS